MPLGAFMDDGSRRRLKGGSGATLRQRCHGPDADRIRQCRPLAGADIDGWRIGDDITTSRWMRRYEIDYIRWTTARGVCVPGAYGSDSGFFERGKAHTKRISCHPRNGFSGFW